MKQPVSCIHFFFHCLSRFYSWKSLTSAFFLIKSCMSALPATMIDHDFSHKKETLYDIQIHHFVCLRGENIQRCACLSLFAIILQSLMPLLSVPTSFSQLTESFSIWKRYNSFHFYTCSNYMSYDNA